MFDGMPYLLAQIAVPVVVAALVGAVAGWVLRAGTTRLAGTDTALADAQRSVRSLQAELAQLRDEKDAEMGRLETHAIEAMESTMSHGEQRIRSLEAQLADARTAMNGLQDELTTQRGQCERLRKALAERDERISRLGRQS